MEYKADVCHPALFEEIEDFLNFKGIYQNNLLEELILFLDLSQSDTEFTDSLIVNLIKSNMEELGGYEEDKEHYKSELISFISKL